MKNSFIFRLKNTLCIKVKGKNIERFIKRVVSLKVDIYNIEHIKYNEIIIEIDKENYEKIVKFKTIYELEIVNIKGIDKFKIILKKNKYVIICLIISFILLYFLSNTIFKIEVIHNDPDLRKLLISELEENNMRVFSLKKDYVEIQKIKKKILEKYKDKIEWLEIKTEGTKYVVRVEERIINKLDNNYIKRDIVAKKDAMILRVEAKSGEIIKFKNSYVKKGDTIITGSIKLNEETKQNIMAIGTVYGEVWYKVTVEYPLNYYEEVLTGKTKKVYAFNFLNHSFEFSLKKLKNKKIDNDVILSHNFLPINFSKQKQYEIKKIKQSLTKDEAIKKAIEKAKDKINSKLSDNEYIIETKKLKVEQNNSKIVLELFISVYEDITDYKEIVEAEIETGD